MIASFADLAAKHRLALIVDETYRDFVPSGEPPHSIFTRPTPWRPTFIHLFSFSKSYCLPGHRLGAIVASPEFLSSVKTVLDCLQICPPRPVQLGLASLLLSENPDYSLRTFVRENAQAVQARHVLFKNNLPPRWKIGAQGGYFAFVKHPFEGVRAESLARELVEREGLLALPATFFTPTTTTKRQEGEDTMREPRSDDIQENERWLRFSVANVDDGKVVEACRRLATFRMPS